MLECARRWSGFAAAAAFLAACGGTGPVSAPGGRDGIRFRYLTPPVQVVAAGEEATVELALRVEKSADGADLVPLSGVRLDIRRESGEARPSADRVMTDSGGVARIDVEVPGGVDKSRFRVALDSDDGSWVPFDVVSARVVQIDLPVGGARYVDFPRDGALLRFRMAPGTDWVLVPYSTDYDRSGVPYRFIHAASAGDPGGVRAGLEPVDVPHARGVFPASDAGHVTAGAIPPGALTPAAGELPSRVSIRSCRIDSDRTAPLRYVGRHVALYVDAPEDRYQPRIDSIGRAFDDDIFPRNTALFGQTTDYDGNGVVIVVMSPELQDIGGVYCDTIRTLDLESFYAGWNPVDRIDRPLATLAHEHQHVINAGYHRQTRGGIGDEPWLNEGLSYAAEPLNGYWAGALTRMWQFLNGQNTGLSILPLEYASAFNDEYMMFVLWLGDRFGQGVYHTLETSGRVGKANVEYVTGEAFDSLLEEWYVANVLSNRGLNDDPRYNYRSIDLMGMADRIEDCQCLPKRVFDGMNFEPLSLGTTFDVGRTLDRADADYFRLVPADSAATRADLYMDAFGRQTVHLAVVRLR